MIENIKPHFRLAGSRFTGMEAPELIAPDLDDYHRIARALATNHEKLNFIREKILENRERTPLFDSVGFTRSLEALYSGMAR